MSDDDVAVEVEGTAKDKLILAVDDMAEILTAITEMLSGHYKVIGVKNFGGVLKVISKHTPSLFLLDVEMPPSFYSGMNRTVANGYDIAEILRDMPRFCGTPILFLTSVSTKNSVVEAMNAGGNGYLVKPVNQDVLLEKIKTLLAEHDAANSMDDWNADY